ncbi:MAG TPA: hypothetical protein VMM15_41060 [Bradyrhizobium sp.]|nr:hypothetical protein [Bradyrhizobium sp.]
MIDDAAIEMALGYGGIPAHVGPIGLEVFTQAARDPNGPAGVRWTLFKQKNPDRIF